MTLRTLIVLTATVLSAGTAAALPPAEKCEAGKLKQAGKYGFCRLKVEMKAVKTGNAPDYSQCDAKFGVKWTEIENEGGAMCPTSGDQAALAIFIAGHTDTVAMALRTGAPAGCGQRIQTGQTTCYDVTGSVIACAATGQDGELQKGLTPSFTDNGDGTISDHQTGLMWEKLSDDGSIHDWDDTYTWVNAFAAKIATLNSTLFGGYNDWRLPNVNELQSLTHYSGVVPNVHAPFDSGCSAGCTVLTCSCTNSFYWASTSPLLYANFAYFVRFDFGLVAAEFKTTAYRVRAVRGGV